MADEEAAFQDAKQKHTAFQKNPSRAAFGRILRAEGLLMHGQLPKLLEENKTFAENHNPDSQIWKTLLSDEEGEPITRNIGGSKRRRRKSKKRKYTKKRKSRRRRRTRR